MNASTSPLVVRARALAIAAHGTQTYGKQPYVVHLDAVAELLMRHGFGGEDQLAAAYLHDILEDTPTRVDELAKFGPAVVHAVVFCSDEPGPSRKIRKAATYARMAQDVTSGAPWVGLAIRTKVADRLANVRASAGLQPSVPATARLVRVYQGEHTTFRNALYVADNCDAMWRELDELLTPKV
ncbi:MAG: HD domain-containing protein [Nannocystaceae bacterium]